VRELHIFEPTLVSAAGHCYHLSKTLVQVWALNSKYSKAFLWTDRRFPRRLIGDIFVESRLTLVPRFNRLVRKLQQFLFFRLVWKKDAVIVIPTVRLIDLLILRLAKPAYPLAKAFGYIHWMKMTPTRLRALAWVMLGVPELSLLTATEELATNMSLAGITRVTYQPYPITTVKLGAQTRFSFRHLLYAGAARWDKGFAKLVDVIEMLAERGRLPPTIIQVNGERSGKVETALVRPLERIRKLANTYPQIRLINNALDSEEYYSLFDGAIAIQLYDPSAFANRVSGVTLDALALGAIPLVRDGTWSAQQLRRLGSGFITASDDPAVISRKIEEILSSIDLNSACLFNQHTKFGANWSVFLRQLSDPYVMAKSPCPLKPPRRILIVQMRRMGDVLLTTPLIRALKKNFPSTEVSALVFDSTATILNGNSDLAEIISLPSKPSLRSQLSLAARLFLRFDLAFCLTTSDRPLVLTRLAGRKAFAFARRGLSWVFTATAPFDDLLTHTVAQNLRLARLVGLQSSVVVVAPRPLSASRQQLSRPFIVVHPCPKFEYKRWSPLKWQDLINQLIGRGFKVMISGGSDQEEKEYNQQLIATEDKSGQLSWGDLAEILKDAAGFVGPDTASTHLAAAIGIPTVALFGPSNPTKWGPWPKAEKIPQAELLCLSLDQSPWSMRSPKVCGNVAIVQGMGDCVPCRLEGCDRHINSRSVCLDQISVESVLKALDAVGLQRGVTAEEFS
jgi:heptosyltransferase III